ncbi:methyl-accepting chemotaxis protein [Parashewanella tropica]|uniref:methyl-accepting chemotaxis protein n=1 Tax=Parashewanella tropica TaxID=2547970 RepID=UPI0010595A53|nr:methyl-accepting chemotaxis protein [Parashewanella tropica]
MANLGFKRALILSMIVLCTTVLLTANFLSYLQIRNATINEVNQTSRLIVETEAAKIERWFESKADVVKGLVSSYKNGNMTSNYVSVAKTAKETGKVTAVFLGFDDGNTYSTAEGAMWNNGIANKDQYKLLSRPWYKQAKTASGTDVTGVYADATTGNDVVSIIESLGNGAALIDIELPILNETVREIDYPGAVTLIADNDGKIMASNSKVAVKGTFLRDAGMSDVERNMLSKTASMQDYTLKGVDKIAFTKAINLVNGKRWYLFIGVNKSVAYAHLGTVLKNAILSSLIMIVIATLLILLVLKKLYRPIDQLKSMIGNLAQGNGDLTKRLPVESNDDLGIIASDINKFISELQTLMKDVQHASGVIDKSIKRLQADADANSQILNAHTQETELIVTAIEEMSATANNVARNGSETAAFTKTTNDKANSSKVVVHHATDTVAQLVQDVDATADNISEIDRDTQEIEHVLKVIGDIAEQTNLLALNAAIEAARAGEQGRGFAVVADEVRALAARTQSSTAEIEQTISKLRQGTNSAIEAMQVTKSTCEQTADATEKVATDLDEIALSVDQINDLNTQIATAAEEQSSVSDEITRNMAAINEMVNELSMNGQTTVAQTSNLFQINKELTGVVRKFKLD